MPSRLQRDRSRLLPRNDEGLSLVEMIVAIGVTMVVLISAGAAFVKMSEAQRSAEAGDRATQMIQDRLETIRTDRYVKVGCYDDDGTDPVTGALLCPKNDLVSGEVVVRLGAVRAADPSRGQPALPIETVYVGENVYTVKTVVTFAARPGHLLDKDVPGNYPNTEVFPATQGTAPYLAKRVKVSASWTLGAKTRTVSREWLRSPTSSEVYPPAAGHDSGRRCALDAPFCTINITDGQVLTAGTVDPTAQDGLSQFVASRPIRFTVQLSVRTKTATITYGTITTPTLNAANGGVTNDGYTLTYVIPVGGATGGVKPGASTVSIWADTISGPRTQAKDVHWRFPVATASAYQLADLHGVWDSLGGANPSLPPTGWEQAKDWFCVKTTDNKLWRNTAVIFDELNVDEMDSYAPPKLYATGMNPEFSSAGAVFSQHPSGPRAGYLPAGGYLGTKMTASGSLNQIRWSYGFRAGTEFPGTTSNIIISGERPADGAIVNASLTMPVYAVPDVSYCEHADTYAPNDFLTGKASGQTNKLTWDPNKVDWGGPSNKPNHYKLYREGTPTDTLIYSGNKPDLNFDDTVPWGSTNTYYVVAEHGSHMEFNSNTVTMKTSPGPSVLSGKANLQTNTLNWTPAEGAPTSYTLYRVGAPVGTPDTLIRTGAELTWQDDGSWGSASSYYVIASSANGAGPTSNTVTLTTPPAIPLAPTSAPTVSVAPGGAGFVVTCPTAPAGVAWVSIYRLATTLPVKAQTAANTAWTDTTTITHTTSSTYYCSHGNAGGESAKGPGATIRGASVVLAAPSAPTLELIWGRSARFSWPAVTGAVSYTLTAGGISSTVTTTTTSVVLPAGADLTATVTAVSAWGLGSVSSGTSVLMPNSQVLLNTGFSPGVGSFDSRRNNAMVSRAGTWVANFGSDGNFVIRSVAPPYTIKYETGTIGLGTYLALLGDGNFVMYSGVPDIRQTQTNGDGVALMLLQDDGNLVLNDANGKSKWSAHDTKAGGTNPYQIFFR